MATWTHPVARREDVAAVAYMARSVAHSLSFSSRRCGGVAIVAAELASNVVKHAGGGEIEISIDGPSRLLVVAYDRGPSIRDFAIASADGCDDHGPIDPAALYGRHGLATGLAAVRRLADRFGCRQGAAGKAVWAAFDAEDSDSNGHPQVTRPPQGHAGDEQVSETTSETGELAGVEVSGESILSVIVGMGAFESTARRFLREGGLEDVVPGGWYPVLAWLRAFDQIAKKIGPRTLYYIGTKIPETAMLPPGIEDVPSALRAIDVGYHLNHRRGGKVMFDLAAGRMTDGIGHYGLVSSAGSAATLRCDNPYPCDFDHGIVHGFATRFAPEPYLVRVMHLPQACRNRGDAGCEFRVEWK